MTSSLSWELMVWERARGEDKIEDPEGIKGLGKALRSYCGATGDLASLMGEEAVEVALRPAAILGASKKLPGCKESRLW